MLAAEHDSVVGVMAAGVTCTAEPSRTWAVDVMRLLKGHGKGLGAGQTCFSRGGRVSRLR